MKSLIARWGGACAALLLASAAHADVTLNSVRVAAADTVALAKFYQSAFVMQEVNRIDVPGGPERMLLSEAQTVSPLTLSVPGGSHAERTDPEPWNWITPMTEPSS